MAYTQQPDKTLIAYDNKIRVANISSIDMTNLPGDSNGDVGFTVANLQYEDPQRLFKTSVAPTGNPLITITFSASQTFNCAGIVNHNIVTQGYTGWVAEYYNSGWQTLGSNRVFPGTFNTDGDMLLRFDQQSSTQWRFQLQKSSGWPTFYIGMLFLGTYYECPRQPIDGGITRNSEAVYVSYAGGGNSRIVLGAAARPRDSGELLFERVEQAQASTMIDTIARRNAGRIIAVVPPDEAGTDFPVVHSAHLFARLRNVRHRQRVGSPVTHDVAYELEGVLF